MNDGFLDFNGLKEVVGEIKNRVKLESSLPANPSDRDVILYIGEDIETIRKDIFINLEEPNGLTLLLKLHLKLRLKLLLLLLEKALVEEVINDCIRFSKVCRRTNRFR
jgi:hypothetical protein